MLQDVTLLGTKPSPALHFSSTASEPHPHIRSNALKPASCVVKLVANYDWKFADAPTARTGRHAGETARHAIRADLYLRI